MEGLNTNSINICKAHGDHVKILPEGFINLGSTKNTPYEMFIDENYRVMGL